MKAQQFIKEYGLEKARAVVEVAPDGHKGYNGVINQYTRGVWFSRDVMLSDLKRLVESVDIINELEGIEGAKGTLTELVKLDLDEFEHRWIDGWMCARSRLEKAITDYESIYGEGNV